MFDREVIRRRVLAALILSCSLAGLAACKAVQDESHQAESVPAKAPSAESSGDGLSEQVRAEGGHVLVYRAADERDRVIEIVRRRLDALEAEGAKVVPRGSHEFEVRLSGALSNQLDRTKSLIETRGQLRVLKIDDDQGGAFFEGLADQLEPGLKLRRVEGGFFSITHRDKDALRDFFDGRAPEGRTIGYQFHAQYETAANRVLDEENSYWKSYLLHDESKLSGEHLHDVQAAVDEHFNRPYVALEFNEEGTKRLSDLTSNNVGERIAIVVDDEVQTAPVINEPITGGRVQLSMGTLKSHSEVLQEAQDLVLIIRGQMFPAPIELISVDTVEPPE
jgi:preprotein translocase subunit SecD